MAPANAQANPYPILTHETSRTALLFCLHTVPHSDRSSEPESARIANRAPTTPTRPDSAGLKVPQNAHAGP